MIRWLAMFAMLLTSCSMNAESIARDPYLPIGFPACKGKERGYWQVMDREANEKTTHFLFLTSVDVADPAFVICWVPGNERVEAVGPEKKA